MKTIREIIADKKIGIDCTEDESAELKGFIKSEIKSRLNLYQRELNEVKSLFSQEYGEAIDEMFSIGFLNEREYNTLLNAC